MFFWLFIIATLLAFLLGSIAPSRLLVDLLLDLLRTGLGIGNRLFFDFYGVVLDSFLLSTCVLSKEYRYLPSISSILYFWYLSLLILKSIV
jgi:hypothetical protein